jgi:hypothetical protein
MNYNLSRLIVIDFINFNTWLFQIKLTKYLLSHNSNDSEIFAKKEIEEMTIPEYIESINAWKNRG